MQQLLHLLLLLGLLFIHTTKSLAQGSPDCSGAFTLCNDASISFNPSGIGSTNDFATPGNSQGCLSGGENNTAWYYFEFNASTPPGSQLTFTISPVPSADYDFAVYGPGVSCGALGSPIRCSWAGGSIPTGLGNGATDFSEGAGGDGFVAPLTVNPGEGYYLVVDNWSGNSNAFTLDFGGSASSYLDCAATPCMINLNYTPSYSVCGGDPPIQLSGSVTGNSGTETYLWTEPSGGTIYMSNPSSPNPTLSFPPGLTANYQYTLTVMDATCTESTTVTVSVNPQPTVTITGDASICQGGSGTLSATAGYSSYVWSPFGNGQSINISAPGLYTVTVTGAGGCQNFTSFNVTQSPAPTPVISGPATLCTGVSAVLDAGAGYDTYIWQDGSTNPTLNINNPGTYSVTVTAGGCQGVASINIAPGQDVPVSIIGDNIICAGGNTFLDAGPGYSSYTWQDGTTMPTLFVDTPGNYSLTVTDASGCSGTTSFTVNQSPPFTPSINGDFTICTNNPASLEADPTYSAYLWSSNETSSFITPQTPGIYTVTVTDASGCQGTNTVTVQTVPDPMPVIDGNLEICAGQTTTLSTSPGYVTYDWSTGSSNFNTNVLNPGSVSLIVTDMNGCQGIAIADVIESQPPQVNISGPTQICSSNPISLSATPGYANYLWSTTDVTPDISVSNPGTYFLTVTNQTGCETVVQHLVTPSPPPEPSIDGNTSICNGGSTLLTVTGGIFDHYLWSDGTTNPTLEVLTPGLVSVTVTDANGCEGSTSLNVSSEPSPTVMISGNPQFCEGEATTLNATAGFNSYLWSDGTPNPSINITTPGLYELTVSDAQGCEATTSITVDQLPAPSPTLSGNPNFCEGSSAQISVNENFVEYLWYDDQTGQTATIDIEGYATVTVTDQNGCLGTTEIDIFQSPAPTPVIIGPVGLCEEETALLDAGAGFTTYLWEDDSNDQFFQATQAGTYSVTVSNAEGCEAATSIDLVPFASPNPQIYGDSSICTGINSVLTAESGFESYEWQDNTTENTLNVIVGGSYSVTVTDINGCQGTSSVLVTENPPLEPEITGETALCEGQNTQLATMSSYNSYLWSDGSNTSFLAVDTAGTYTVTVTDAEGCTGSDDIIITLNPLPEASISGLLSFCANGQTTLSAPTGLSAYLWSNDSTTATIIVDQPATYEVIITDENGCQNTSAVQVNQVEELLPVISGQPAFCAGGSTIIDAGAAYDTYLWSDNTENQQLEVNSAGTYAVTVTDANGCLGSTSIDVIENQLPAVEIAGETGFCTGDSTLLVASSGFESYEWQNGSLSSDIYASTPGTYSVIVTDENGCQNTSSTEISAFELPTPMISGATFFCPGTSTDLSTSAGYSSYSWSSGQNTAGITASASGSYILTVTDINGCEGSTSVDVNEFEVIPPPIDGPDAFCPGTNTTLQGEMGYQNYIWSNNAISSETTISSPGTYSLTATDQNGCESSSSIAVDFFTVTNPSISGEPQFCEGTTTTLIGDIGYVDYSWSNGIENDSITINSGGLYELSVIDSNGCITSQSIQITENGLPEVVIGGSSSFCTGGFTTLNAGNTYENYLWSSGSDSASIQVATVGTYELTVTDINGCEGSTSIDVEEASELSPVISGPQAFCPGESIMLDAGEGFATYQWSDGTQDQLLSVESAGDYSLTVTDPAGCSGNTTISIAEHPNPTPSIAGEVGFCEGTSTLLEATGGNFISTLWSEGSTENSIIVDTAGDYSLNIIDENGCAANTSVNVISYPLPEFDIQGALGFCENTGTTLTATEGYATYLWSNDQSANAIDIDTPDTYGLTVTSAEGCTQQAAVVVTQYSLPEPAILGQTSFCYGGTTQLNANNTFSSYAWSNGSTDASIIVSAAGTYELTVSDNNGCTQSTMLVVNDDIVIQPQITGILDFCPGTGTTLDVGNNYLDYQWEGGQEVSSIEVTTPGLYQVTVVDTEGCIGETSAVVNQWPQAEPEINGNTGFCEGASTILNVSGGSFETYEWSNGQDESVVVIDQPGDYTVSVIDANNCEASATLTLEAYPLPVFSINGATTFCEDGETVLSSSDTFASYEWSDNSTEEQVTVDQTGSYSLTATNTFGCSHTETITVEAIALPEADAGADASINCYLPSISLGGDDNSQGDYTFNWAGPGINADNENDVSPTVDIPGTYTLQLTDNQYGCMSPVSSVEVVDQTEEPQVILQVLDVLDCTTSSVLIDGSNSTSGNNIIYQWYDAELNPISTSEQNTLEVSNPELFYLLVTDTLNGCNAMDSILVQEDESYPIAEAGESYELNCAVQSVGLDGTASQQGDAINYTWYTSTGNILQGNNSPTPTISEPGWYFIDVMDSENGCTNSDSVFVSQDIELPIVQASNDQTIDCINTTALLDAEGSSTGSEFMVEWSEGSPENVFSSTFSTTVNEPGTYYLIVTNQNNQCSSIATVEIDENSAAPSAMQLSVIQPTCFNDQDGSITIEEVTGGTPPYLYSINEAPLSSLLDFNQLGAGNYEVMVQDATGCEHTMELTLAEGNDLFVDLGEDIEAKLGETVNLEAIASISQDEIVDFTWTATDSLSCNQCLNPAVFAAQSGPYALQITDANGCVATDEVYIFVDNRKNIYLPTAFSPNGDDSNDIFYVQGGQNLVKIKTFQVYNRWGEPVFEVYNAPANDPFYGWNGSYKGEVYNSAVFTWFAEIEFIDGQVVLFKGDVILMR